MGKTAAEVRERKELILQVMSHHTSITDAFTEAGLNSDIARHWKARDPVFKERYDKQRLRMMARKRDAAQNSEVYDPSAKQRPKARYEEWLRDYIGFGVPEHLQAVVEMFEDHTNLVMFVLLPPGGGKDTTGGFFCTYESCDGYKRVAWIMEAEKFSIRRMNDRLSPYLTDPKTYGHTPDIPGGTRPTRNLIDDYGPFEWNKDLIYPDGSKVKRRRWSAEEKYFVSSRAPEADPNLWATGVSGKLYGARVDLMVISDPFTAENQRSPTLRASQLDWIRGTVKSRLDEGGRLIFLGTRVAHWDNYGVLLDEWTKVARVVKQEGPYTKWSNGTATVVLPAIQRDSDGGEVSYWPEKFPLEGKIITPDGTEHPSADLSDADIEHLASIGGRRERGLLEIRDESPSTFEVLYQQNPRPDMDGEFTMTLLNHCDDASRTLGVYDPKEDLVLGVDPARTGGAGWVLWGYNRDKGTATVVDLFYGEKLGMQGIKEKLLLNPIGKYFPRYLVYETNWGAEYLEFPEIKDAIRATATEVVQHNTNSSNRSQGEASVAGMALDMRSRMIRFPASTVDDERRMRLLKEHFMAWDSKTVSQARSRSGQGGHQPDDLCMAAWVGFTKVKEIAKRTGRRLVQRQVPAVVRQRFGRTIDRRPTVAAAPPETDLLAAWMGDGNND